MKRAMIVLLVLLILFQNVNSQNNNQRKKTQTNNTATQRTGNKIQPTVQQQATNGTPYPPDSLLWIKSNSKPAATNVSGKNTNPETNGQNRSSIQQPAANNPKWRDDSLLWIKNNPKPAATNVSGKTTNNQSSNRYQRVSQPNSATINQTKLDDLKNPFDSTKKVKPGVQSGQAPASQKGRANRQ